MKGILCKVVLHVAAAAVYKTLLRLCNLDWIDPPLLESSIDVQWL